MYNQMDESRTKTVPRDFCSEQEICFSMGAQNTLSLDERQLLAGQAGHLLVAIGNLLANHSAVGAHVSAHTSGNLVRLGRKLILAGECACNL